MPLTPRFLRSPSTLILAIGGSQVTLLAQSLTWKDTLDQRATCSFTIRDDTGTLILQPGQPVQLSDTNYPTSLGGPVLFTGSINDVQSTLLYPATTMLHQVQCVDQHANAGRRVALRDYQNQYAGDIVSDILTSVLQPDGLTATSAVRRDSSSSQLSTGTLVNTVTSSSLGDGDLELAPTGTPLTHTIPTLPPTTMAALKFQATATVPGGGDLGIYRKIWQGSALIHTNDGLFYDLWITSPSPEIKAGIDFTCTDGTIFRLTPGVGTDSQGMDGNPATDLSGLANDQWYTRNCGLTSEFFGKTIASVSVGIEGDKVGSYTVFFRHIHLSSSSGNTTFFESSLAVNPSPVIYNNGYATSSLSVITVADASTPIFSGPFALDSVGLVATSQISLQNITVGNSTAALDASLDGLTWQSCSTHQSLPCLLAGMNLSGKSIQFRSRFSLGTDPSQIPSIGGSFTVFPSSVSANKTDLIASTTDFSSGSLSSGMVGSSGSLTLQGFQRNYDNAYYGGQTVFGPAGASQYLYNKQLVVTAGVSSDARVRFDTAGQWQNFTYEVDVLVSALNSAYGVVYRTTGWQNTTGTYAYAIYVASSTIYFWRGSNNSSGGGVQLALTNASLTLSVGNWHHLKVVVNGSNHRAYLDDVLYLNVTDSTYTAAGSIGLYFNNASTTATDKAYFDNVGIATLPSGTRVSPALALTSVGILGTSALFWQATTPDGTSLLVEASTDGGTTWQACTNGGPIPSLSPGQNIVTISLQTRITLSTTNVALIPVLQGLTLALIGQTNASGIRVSPPLSLAPVGRAGATLISWNGSVPTNTALFLDASLDGATWTPVGSGPSGGVPIPGITIQPDPLEDSFAQNTSPSYLSTSGVGGTLATWTWNTTQSRITVTGGNQAQLLAQSFSPSTDIEVLTDLDLAEAAGLVWRVQNASNFYETVISDQSSGMSSTATSGPDTMQCWKIQGGTRTALGSLMTGLGFIRGTPHRLRIQHAGIQLSVWWDGLLLLSFTEGSLLSVGAIGLRTTDPTSGGAGGAIQASYYQLRIQALGDDVSGKQIWTRIRLSSTDPTVSPQLSDLTVSVHSPAIGNGALIPTIQTSILGGSTSTIDKHLDDLAKQSNYWWRIRGSQLLFQPRQAQPAPWCMIGSDILAASVSLERANDLYRNSQWVQGGIDTTTLIETRIGDGVTQSWQLSYPLSSLLSVTVNGQNRTWGLIGIDTGKDFYGKPGNQTLVQDVSALPIDDTETIQILYQGQVPVVVNVLSSGQIALFQSPSLLGGTGLVEAVEQVQGLSKLAALQLAQARLNQYGVQARILTCTTLRPGLQVGQLLTVWLPQFGLKDATFLITDVSVSWQQSSSGVQAWYQITATDGPVIGSWTHFLSAFSTA